jgi:hypothetical protein
MKKGFQILSILFLLGWLSGVFIFHVGMPVHVCLAVSLLLYIQSVITPDSVAEAEPETGY